MWTDESLAFQHDHCLLLHLYHSQSVSKGRVSHRQHDRLIIKEATGLGGRRKDGGRRILAGTLSVDDENLESGDGERDVQ